MIDYVPKDAVVLSVAEARRYVVGAAVVYFVLIMALLFVTSNLATANSQIATWRHAYCVQNARLFAAQNGPSYLQSDIASCP